MRTGVSYMGHHNPKHIRTDLEEMRQLQLDDLLVAAQENDFRHFPGKVEFTPAIARELDLRPIAILWGAFNLFGGGRSSHFLLEHPDCFQQARDGSHLPAGCYNNPTFVQQIQALIDRIAEVGFAAYFIDEPKPLRDCFCPACRHQFEAWYDASLLHAPAEQVEIFRQRCVIEYTRRIADYCKANHPALETMLCLMPEDRAMWQAAAAIDSLDNIGTDIYWINQERAVEEMKPILDDMATLARQAGKVHHEWLQCFNVRRGQEHRVLAQGEILIRERPDALYIWAWEGQIGTSEACDDPAAAWAQAKAVLRLAKAGDGASR